MYTCTVMDNLELVLGVLHSLLGQSKKAARSHNYSFLCPICNHRKPKLTVNLETGEFNCWTCIPPTKGKTLIPLLKLVKASKEQIEEVREYYKLSPEKSTSNLDPVSVELPKEFKFLNPEDNSFDARHARSYLRGRGINQRDIDKYNIGYCSTGQYRNRVIIPSYDSDGKLNYFIARSTNPDSTFKIDSPSCDKTSIIGFEYFINWDIPVILCEGVFDAIAIKRNSIPLFGKTLPKALMMRITKPDVKTVYLALDDDAIKASIDYSEKLLDLGKEVYLINLNGKDPSEIGFESMIKNLQSAKPLTFKDVLKYRLELS